MTSIGYATLDVIPSFKNLSRDLDRGISGPMRTAALTGGTQFGDVAGKSAGSRFGSIFKRTAQASMVGLAAAGAAAFKFGGDALEEAREAQKVGAQTDAVLRSTGKAAKVTARDIGRLTGRLSDMAGVDDELIQGGANTLLTFTNIRNEVGKGNKIFDRATLAALNMSTALGSDLGGASIQLGKALNDPVKGVTALGRAGVQFSEDQKKAIKTMVESGDTLGAQKLVLKELDTQFRGSARAQATEADKLQVAFGNLQEEVGTALIPVMDDLAVFLRKKGIPAAQDFFGWVQDDGLPALRDFKDDLKPVIRGTKDLVDLFSSLPSSAKIASLGGALAGGVVVKHQVGKLFERGGTPATPMYVRVTNPGVATGTATPDGKPKGGRGAGIAGALGVLAGPWIIEQLQAEIMWPAEELKRLEQADRQRQPLTFETQEGAVAFIDAAQKKAEGFGATLDLVGGKKVEPKFAVPGLAKGREGLAEFIRLQMEAGNPITPYINTTPIERAIQQARTLNRELAAAAVPERGIDNGAGYMSGGTGTNGRAGGVNFNGPINVQAHDYDDFMKQMQRRQQKRGMGGFGY
jgi:hypothetical protein